MDFERAHEGARAFLREAGIPYVDLYPPLRSVISRGERPYLNRDMHWNARGHQVVVEAIQGWLVDHCAELGLPVAGCGSSAPSRGRATPPAGPGVPA